MAPYADPAPKANNRSSCHVMDGATSKIDLQKKPPMQPSQLLAFQHLAFAPSNVTGGTVAKSAAGMSMPMSLPTSAIASATTSDDDDGDSNSFCGSDLSTSTVFSRPAAPRRVTLGADFFPAAATTTEGSDDAASVYSDTSSLIVAVDGSERPRHSSARAAPAARETTRTKMTTTAMMANNRHRTRVRLTRLSGSSVDLKLASTTVATTPNPSSVTGQYVLVSGQTPPDTPANTSSPRSLSKASLLSPMSASAARSPNGAATVAGAVVHSTTAAGPGVVRPKIAVQHQHLQLPAAPYGHGQGPLSPPASPQEQQLMQEKLAALNAFRTFQQQQQQQQQLQQQQQQPTSAMTYGHVEQVHAQMAAMQAHQLAQAQLQQQHHQHQQHHQQQQQQLQLQQQQQQLWAAQGICVQTPSGVATLQQLPVPFTTATAAGPAAAAHPSHYLANPYLAHQQHHHMPHAMHFASPYASHPAVLQQQHQQQQDPAMVQAAAMAAAAHQHQHHHQAMLVASTPTLHPQAAIQQQHQQQQAQTAVLVQPMPSPVAAHAPQHLFGWPRPPPGTESRPVYDPPSAVKQSPISPTNASSACARGEAAQTPAAAVAPPAAGTGDERIPGLGDVRGSGASAGGKSPSPQQLQEFVAHFKERRTKLGYTQTDVGVELRSVYGAEFSQATICRFESLQLSYDNLCRWKAMLEKWLALAESRGPTWSSSQDNLAARKRRRRTTLGPSEKAALERRFLADDSPTSEDMVRIGEELGLDRRVVRTWFCNQRQKVKRLRVFGHYGDGGGAASDGSGASDAGHED